MCLPLEESQTDIIIWYVQIWAQNYQNTLISFDMSGCLKHQYNRCIIIRWWESQARLMCLREARPYHYRWIFGKVPNGLWPPPRAFFGKNVAIFSKIMTTSTEFATKFFGSEMTPPLFQSFSGNSWPKVQFLMQKNCNEIFWIRKFICFGKDRLP